MTDGAGGASFAVTLLVRNVLAPNLEVTAPTITFDGTKGGPFNPSSVVITVTNKGDLSLNWQGTVSAPWLTLWPTNSTLSAGEATNVVLTINSAVTDLTEGSFQGQVNFENLINGQGNALVDVLLTVRAPTPVATISEWPIHRDIDGANRGQLHDRIFGRFTKLDRLELGGKSGRESFVQRSSGRCAGAVLPCTPAIAQRWRAFAAAFPAATQQHCYAIRRFFQ